jgi:hypothetical protein
MKVGIASTPHVLLFVPLELFEQNEPRFLGHHNVQEDKFGLGLLCFLQAFVAIVGEDRIVSVLASQHGKKAHHVPIVVNYQNLSPHCVSGYLSEVECETRTPGQVGIPRQSIHDAN